MCLSSITQKFKVPDPKVQEGWKVFIRRTRLRKKVLCFEYYYYTGVDDVVRTGKWLKAKSTVIRISSVFGDSYKSGFHVFMSKAGARAWKSSSSGCIVKVKVRNVTVIGRQLGHEVMIAQEMLVPRQVRRKR